MEVFRAVNPAIADMLKDELLDTIYQAATNGEVCAFQSNINSNVIGYVDPKIKATIENEDKINKKIRSLAIAELKASGEIPADYVE